MLLLLLCGCRTTEANYKAAYDVAAAKAAQRAQLDEEDRFYNDLFAKQRRQRTVYIVGPDTLSVSTMMLAPVEQGSSPATPEQVHQYSIVVNGFEQQFNAQAMCKRLQENGFPEAYVAKVAKPYYYVMTAGTDDIKAVPALLRQADKARSLGMSKEEYPLVVKNGLWRPQ